MSKTAQRKAQAKREGYLDAVANKPLSRKKQAYAAQYKAGYRQGKQKREWVPLLGYDDL